ncbi:hypothetical protein LQW54_006594 [Pestalotiopsis sp. IQ-011]
MGTCICSSVHHLAESYDEDRARSLVSALNSHLKDLSDLLSQSRLLCREVQYRITPINQLTTKVLSVESVDRTPVDQVCERFREDSEGFWSESAVADGVHSELRRRLACVVIFLRSKLNAQAAVPPQIANVFSGQPDNTNFRNFGRKYIHIARKLGSIGAIFWLPLSIGHSTSVPLKNMLWPILDNATKTYTGPSSARSHVLEVMLYFAERDSTPTRWAALDRARTLVRQSMPYYLQASVVLFQSILYRLDGDYVKSEGQIRNFMWRGPRPVTRRDHALEGRLHISQTENKIKCYDNDVPSFIYKWTAELPLSSLDVEVTFRLQSIVARFFQSIGDFAAARASLEQFVTLNAAKPIRSISRRMLIGRLADMYCEMREYTKVLEVLQREFDRVDAPGRLRRNFRRLLFSVAEANIGLGRLDAARPMLQEVQDKEPGVMDNMHDQHLHMRRVLADARIVHLGPDRHEAVRQWRLALRKIAGMNIIESTDGFTATPIYLSLAHAQLTTGDRPYGCRRLRKRYMRWRDGRFI